MLRDDELTDQERQWKAELYRELLALRDRVQPADGSFLPTGQPSSIWYFSGEEAVSIVCAEAPDPPSYARGDNLNYTRSAKFADLDALLAVLEQVKAVNPESTIRIMPPRNSRNLRQIFFVNI